MFKQIPNYPNYAINYEGQVINQKTKHRLKPVYDPRTGYCQVCLKQKTYRIHRLMGLTFLPNFYNKYTVDHINRLKTDNRLWNLRWATSHENSQNLKLFKTNKLKERNISKHNKYGYEFKKMIKGKAYRKHFRTLEQCINYRDNKLYLSGV